MGANAVIYEGGGGCSSSQVCSGENDEATWTGDGMRDDKNTNSELHQHQNGDFLRQLRKFLYFQKHFTTV